MNKLLLVDGSNMVMRAGFGGKMEPERAVQIATGLISRAARQCQATHMVICMDSDAPSFRTKLLPEYKAHRTIDTAPFIRLAQETWMRAKWYVEECSGFEADDLICTIAHRCVSNTEVIILSNDSDLLTLSNEGARILKPENGGMFMFITESDICKKYGVASSALLTDLKAMTGEDGDNIPGVPGIGPKRATNLINKHGNLGMVILFGERPDACKYSKQVYECRVAAQLAFEVITLRKDVPLPPINPANCKIKI